MSRLDHASVELQLDDDTYELRPTPRAMRAINSQFGGIRLAMERVAALDYESIAFIAAAGAGLLGREHKREREGLEEALFDTGLINSLGAVTEYLSGLLDPTGTQDEEAGDKGKSR